MTRLLILPLLLSACAHVQTLPRADGGETANRSPLRFDPNRPGKYHWINEDGSHGAVMVDGVWDDR